MIELKPCPFCGEKPEIRYWSTNDLMDLHLRLSIRCPNNHAHIEVTNICSGAIDADFAAIEKMKEQATVIWNERFNE